MKNTTTRNIRILTKENKKNIEISTFVKNEAYPYIYGYCTALFILGSNKCSQCSLVVLYGLDKEDGVIVCNIICTFNLSTDVPDSCWLFSKC